MKLFTHALIALSLIALVPSAHAAKTAKKADAPAAAASAWKVDTAASTVKWEGGKKLVPGSHHGTVKIKSGEFQTKAGEITGGTVDIDMTSIANEDLASSPKDQAKLVGHLKSDDFFAVEKFPTANFKITSIKALKAPAAGAPTHEVTGDLTIKGKTSPVTFPVTVTKTADSAKAVGTLTFDRTKYDVRYGSGKFFDNLGDKVIKDEVKLDLNVVAKI